MRTRSVRDAKNLRRLMLSVAIVATFLASGIVAFPQAAAFANGQNAAVVIGHTDFTSKGGGGSSANQTNLLDPSGMAFDSSGNLWVADSSQNRIVEFKAPLSTDESASVVLGKDNFSESTDSCFGSTIVTASCLNLPEGIAFDSSGNLWVADSQDDRALEFTPPFSNGESATLVIGAKDFTSGQDSDANPTASDLNAPAGLTFDSAGNLWIADVGYNRVLEFKAPFSTGESASLVIGQKNFTYGMADYPGCAAGQACPTSSSVEAPIDVKFDSSGDLWVADSAPFRILEFHAPFSTGQAASLVLGAPDFTTYRAGGFTGCTVTPAADCVFPYSLAFDSSGNLWAGDAGFDRVMRFDAPFSNNENATFVLGQPDFVTAPPFGPSTPTASTMGTPAGLAIDSSGNIWVSDQDNNRVLEFLASTASGGTTSSGTSASVSTSTTSSGPTTTSSSGQPTGSTTTTTSSSSGGGGVPVFPYQYALATIFTVILAASYLLVRNRTPRMNRDRP